MISSQKKKKRRPTYPLILKLTARSTANKDIFKDGLTVLPVSDEKPKFKLVIAHLVQSDLYETCRYCQPTYFLGHWFLHFANEMPFGGDIICIILLVS